MPLCAGDARARCMATRPKRVSADWLRNSG
jgi:hypothetical protein